MRGSFLLRFLPKLQTLLPQRLPTTFPLHEVKSFQIPRVLRPSCRFCSTLQVPVTKLEPTMGAVEVESPHFLPKDQIVVALLVKEAFEGLEDRARLYAHHISKASWFGGLIVLHQTSPESPLIFITLHRAFSSQPMKELEEAAKKAGLTEEDIQDIKLYSAGIYANMGNYKGFGDIKIVPRVGVEVFEKFLKSSVAWEKDPETMGKFWELIKGPVYSLEAGKNEYLGFKGKGVTTYFSSNCTEEDAGLVGKFLTKKNIGVYNHRVFKTDGKDGKSHYEIRMAAVKTDPMSQTIEEDFEGAHFTVTRGDYSPLLKLVCKELQKASEYSANENEKAMLLKYVESFEEGSLEAHYDGSRHWIKNKGPEVETYIGFIETYRDPAGVRGEFEGFVAMVNKEMTKRFTALVNNAEKFLTHMPWPKEFEKDKFLQPDFTSLDILTFAGSGIPAGINIPNYDEIRQLEGFKNVSLGNVIFASYATKGEQLPFLSPEDSKKIGEVGTSAFELQVGIHELLGHGSGKLFTEDQSGTFNFNTDLVNPLTNKKVASWYKPGESYDSIFGQLGSAYEECRAETSVLQLVNLPEILEIFGCTGQKAEEMKNIVWLAMIYSGFAKALEHWQPATKTWLQAHSQARFVFLRVLLEAQGGLISIKETTGEDGKPDLRLTVDYPKIDSVGRPAIAEFLKKLQVYKSTGDIESAKGMFLAYSDVPTHGPFPLAKWRDIIMMRKRPRKMLVCPNTVILEGKVNLIPYEDSIDGLIQSFVDRLPVQEPLDVTKIVHDVWKKDLEYFPLK